MPITLKKIKSNSVKKSDSLVIIGDEVSFPTILNDGVFEALSEALEIILVSGIEPNPSKVVKNALELNEKLLEMKVKRAGILGFGIGASIAQAISARTSRFVRRTVLVDALTRVSPSSLERATIFLEKKLPLGLPLRSLSLEYDSRSELHRIQCPTLLIRSTDQDVFLDSQFDLIAERIPNSWKKKLKKQIVTDSNILSEELADLLISFFEVPVKSPQKSL